MDNNFVDVLKSKYKIPSDLEKKRSKVVDEILHDTKIKELIDNLSISMEEINDNIALFINLLISHQECKGCKKTTCDLDKNGFVPSLTRNEYGELEQSYERCEKTKAAPNYLIRDFDEEYFGADISDIEPKYVAKSEDAIKKNAAVAMAMYDITEEKPNKKNNAIITGPRSNGKTYVCAALTNEYAIKGYKCAFIDARNYFSRLISYIAMKENDMIDNVINKACDADVLVIDNLGDEKVSEYTRSVLLDILSSRNSSSKLTVIATCHSEEDMVELYSNIKTTNIKVNRIKAEEVASLVFSLCKKKYTLRND